MDALALAERLLAVAAPLLAFALIVTRRRAADADPASPPRAGRLALTALTLSLGALLFLPAYLFQRWIEAWAGLRYHAHATGDLTALVYAFLVAAPLEQGLKVLAVFPAWSTRSFAGPRDGVLFGAAAALGFVSAHDLELLLRVDATGTDALRALLAAPAHAFFGGAWGLALGREAKQGSRRRLGGTAFKITWLVALIFNGLHDHIVFGKSSAALLTTGPILLLLLGVTLFARRNLDDDAPGPPRARPRRLVIAPPTLGAVRAALWRTEQPVMLGWIGAGSLVTIGVITAALAAAVVLGRRIGVDFAAVDRADGGAAGAAPLVLLGGAALAAFPVAGYLVARASGSRGVLEAAIAAALAMVGGLVLLGLAAPVAVVFALAFAPVALGLSCAGAWLGISR